MQEEAQEQRSAREAELVEVLSSYVEPRAVSYRFVVGFVVAGLAGSISVAWAASQAPIHVPVRFEPRAHAQLEKGIDAFNRGEWDESDRLLSAARASGQVAPKRLEDYIERLALVRRDSERLLRAEEALEVGDPERALALTALIAPNSAFYAQAEVLSRAARAAAEERAAKKLALRMDEEEARQASRAAMARTYTPASPVEPPRRTTRRGLRAHPAGNVDRGIDADW